MIHLAAIHGQQTGAEWTVRRFPVRLGRSPRNDIRLEGEGIWDRHAEIHLRRGEGFVVTTQGEALASVNGQPAQAAVLRNGDVIELGSVRLRFALSPTRPRSLRVREALTWFALAALCCGQATLIYWLVG